MSVQFRTVIEKRENERPYAMLLPGSYSEILLTRATIWIETEFQHVAPRQRLHVLSVLSESISAPATALVALSC
jgi:hypothetical protein